MPNNSKRANSLVTNKNNTNKNNKNKSLQNFIKNKSPNIMAQLNGLVQGMNKIEKSKLEIEIDLNKFKNSTHLQIYDLKSVIVKFYNFVVELNHILGDQGANKSKMMKDLVNKMKGNKAFVNQLERVIEFNNNRKYQTDPNGLNVNENKN